MKLKKAVGALSALAITVSAFAGMAVTANAASAEYNGDVWTIANGTTVSGVYKDRNNVEKNAIGVKTDGGQGNRSCYFSIDNATTADGIIVNASILFQAGNNNSSETYYELLDQNGDQIVRISNKGNNGPSISIKGGGDAAEQQTESFMNTKRADSILGNGLSQYYQSAWTDVSITLNFNEHTGVVEYNNNSYSISLLETSTGFKKYSLQSGRGYGAALISDYNIVELDKPVEYAESLKIRYVDGDNNDISESKDIDVSAYKIGDSYTYYAPKYIVKDGTLYVISANETETKKDITLDSVTNYDVLYNAVDTGVYYFFELDGDYTTRAANESNGSAGATNGGVTIFTAPENGVYKITANCYGGSENRTVTIYKNSMQEDNLLVTSGALSIYANGTDVVAENVELKTGETIIVKGSASTSYMDYAIIQKTGELEVPEPVEPSVNKTVKEVSRSTDLEGNDAISYMAKFDITGSYEVNGVKWTVNGAGDYSESEPKTVDNIFENSTTITNGSIVFGLAIEAVDGLDTIGEVDAELQ